MAVRCLHCKNRRTMKKAQIIINDWRELLPQWLGIVEGSSLERPLGLLKPHLNYKIGYGFLQYCQLVICFFMLNLRAALILPWHQKGCFDFTLTSKANATKRNVKASVSDDAVMRTIHPLVDICLQFHLYLLLFGHLVIVLGQWPLELPQENTIFFSLYSLLPKPSRGQQLHLVRPS